MDFSKIQYPTPTPWFMGVYGKAVLDGKAIPEGSRILFVKDIVDGTGYACNRPQSKNQEGLVVSWPTPWTGNGIDMAAGETFIRFCPIYGKDDPITPGNEHLPVSGDTIRIVVCTYNAIAPGGLRCTICKETLIWSHQDFADIGPLTTLPIGDLTGDAVVDIEDIQAMIDYLRDVNGGLLDAGLADINKDGLVDIGDMMVLADRVFGIPR